MYIAHVTYIDSITFLGPSTKNSVIIIDDKGGWQGMRSFLETQLAQESYDFMRRRKSVSVFFFGCVYTRDMKISFISGHRTPETGSNMHLTITDLALSNTHG